VPTISVFYGIVVRMFVKDHPPPHFHVRYGEYHARVAIDTGDVLDGRLPPRVERLVRQWAELHRGELGDNWARIERSLPPNRIEPLA